MGLLNIQNRIFEIRRQRVMLDYDLTVARIHIKQYYGNRNY